MKKIIAMLLCVAMVAAFGVNAFALTTTTSDSTIDEIMAALKADKDAKDAAKNAIAKYADNLAAAKKLYGDQKDALNAALKATKSAVEVAQYTAVAVAYAEAVEDYIVAVNEAIAQYYLDAGFDKDPWAPAAAE